MRHRILVSLALFLSTVGLSQAAELDITLGNDSLRGEFVSPLGEKVADNVATLDLGVLYSEDDDVDRTAAHVGVLIYGDTGARKANIQAGLGARLMLLDIGDPADVTGAAIALGGTVHGRLPDFNRLGGRLWVFYAPDVSAFDDVEDFVEYGLSIDYQLIRQAFLTGGYRRLRADFGGPGKVDIEDAGFLGLRLVF